MSKSNLSTTEGVRHELFDVFVSGERHTPESGDVLIAYIAECVRVRQEIDKGVPDDLWRQLENERLRVAFDEVAKADPMGWPEGERIILKHLRDAMRGDK